MASNEKKKKTGIIHSCPYDGCNASFWRPYRLEHHLCTHTGERPFSCKAIGCDKKYTSKEHLKRHIASVHCIDEEDDNDDGVKLKCPHCEKILKTSQSLSKHIRHAHEQRVFKCNFCEKSFKKHQHHKIHEASHTGAKPFVCPVEGCGKEYLLPSKLKRHEKIHNGYRCDVASCNEIFPAWSALRKHKVQHKTEIKCDQCSRVFSRYFRLEQHKRSHTDTRKAFHCSYKDCSRYYFYQKNLDQHIKTYHLDERHPCSHEGCSKTFVNKAKLKHHLYLHENPRPRCIPKKCNKEKRKLKKERKKQYRKSIATILTNYDPSKESGLTASSSKLAVQNEEPLSQGNSDSVVLNEISILDDVIITNEIATDGINDLGLSVEGTGNSYLGLTSSGLSRSGLDCASTAKKDFEQIPSIPNLLELKT